MVISVPIVVASGFVAMGFSAALAMALGRVTAQADRDMDQLLADRRCARSITALRRSYAGLTEAQPTLVRDPSIAAGPSRWSVRTRRIPAGSCTSRSPDVWLSTPGGRARV
jgi:hypothetical protein